MRFLRVKAAVGEFQRTQASASLQEICRQRNRDACLSSAVHLSLGVRGVCPGMSSLSWKSFLHLSDAPTGSERLIQIVIGEVGGATFIRIFFICLTYYRQEIIIILTIMTVSFIKVTYCSFKNFKRSRRLVNIKRFQV